MREFFADPVLVSLLVLAAGCGFLALRPRRRTDVLLLILLVGLFALPRAGLVIERVHLPLPLAHVLCGALILEWLLFRRGTAADSFHLGRFFLIYAAVAGMGLVIGLSAGGGPMMAFLELCFYLFSMGLFFYARDTFRQQRHFYTFARWVLILSVCVSGYGIAQRYWGSRTLIGHLTYNTGGSTISRQYVEVDDPAQRRVLSSYGDPNVLAGQLLVFGGIALALLIGKGVPFSTRLFCLLVLGLNGACLLFTRSRAGLIGGVLIVWILFCWRSRWALLG
ncbi:MAG: hypothetical protein JW810_06455, partial [Sedimentisphaerales bacterium]|nr:hypothetical protein [Sedimentisphaerales bacterium]